MPFHVSLAQAPNQDARRNFANLHSAVVALSNPARREKLTRFPRVRRAANPASSYGRQERKILTADELRWTQMNTVKKLRIGVHLRSSAVPNVCEVLKTVVFAFIRGDRQRSPVRAIARRLRTFSGCETRSSKNPHPNDEQAERREEDQQRRYLAMD
jgi:hypothetical protein